MRGQEVTPKYRIAFGTADRLGVFAGRYRFFSPALLYVHGCFQDHLLLDFLSSYSKSAHFMHHLFERRIFRGFQTPDGNADWNHALWAIEEEAYASFERFMLSLVLTASNDRNLFRVGASDVLVYDPLYADKSMVFGPDAPLLKVVVFGVDGNRACVCVDKNDDPVKVDPLGPAVRFLPPQPRTVRAAEFLFGGEDPTPLLMMPGDTKDFSPNRFSQLRAIESLPAPKREELWQAVDTYKKETRQ